MGRLATVLALLLFAGCVSAPAYAQATLYGAVTDESAAKVVEQIQAANDTETKRPVILFIDSDAGSLPAGLKIIDAIIASRRPVWTVCVGTCASMAAIEFTYGAKRAMLPHAMLMFHHENGGARGSTAQILAEVGAWAKQVNEIERHVAKVAHLSLREYQAKESDTGWLLAKEAVKAHVATEIIVLESYPTPSQSKPGLEERRAHL